MCQRWLEGKGEASSAIPPPNPREFFLWHQYSRSLRNDVGFEVLTAVVMKSPIFWDITPCTLLKVNRRFGGTYRRHLRGQRVSQANKQAGSKLASRACYLPHAGFLLGLLFDPEDGGDMFLQNVG
jgi:hypothetical protein